MARVPPPPEGFQRFVDRYPKLGEAWDLMRDAGKDAGSLDSRTQLLVKLAVAIGAGRPGAVHSSCRKARARRIPQKDLEQVIALAAPTIGLPAAVAAHQWVAESSSTADSSPD